jgi:hypothetical protein
VGAAAAGVLSGIWYGFAVAPRLTSSGHAVHVGATGAAAPLCSTPPGGACACLGQTRSGLVVWVVGPRRSNAAKTAGWSYLARRRLGVQEGRRRRLTDFDPPGPWLLFAICSFRQADAMSCLDNFVLSTSDRLISHNPLARSNEAPVSQWWRHSTAGTAADAKTHTYYRPRPTSQPTTHK